MSLKRSDGKSKTAEMHAGCQDLLSSQRPRGSRFPLRHRLWVWPFHSCMDDCSGTTAGMWKQEIVEKPSIINLHVQHFYHLLKVLCHLLCTYRYENTESWSENKINEVVHTQEFMSCLQTSGVSGSGCSPETCFNSCVFGGTVPRGNISHFITSNKLYLIFSKLH